MHVFIPYQLKQVYCINRKSALMIRALFLFTMERNMNFHSFIVLVHMIIPQTKQCPSCAHRDAYLQQADTSEDPAIWI